MNHIPKEVIQKRWKKEQARRKKRKLSSEEIVSQDATDLVARLELAVADKQKRLHALEQMAGINKVITGK